MSWKLARSKKSSATNPAGLAAKMKDNLSSKIFLRESSDYAIKNRSYRKLYSDPSLIANLDIVNELDGHSGCVNALSWSKSGGGI